MPGWVNRGLGSARCRSGASRAALSPPVGHGRRQRDAGQLLRRRREPCPPQRVAAARRMLAEGAAIVDVGGESTRPGSGGRGRRRRSCAGSCPCSRAWPARCPGLDRHGEGGGGAPALELGAELVNDVTALRGDPELAGVVAEAGAYLCLDAHAGRAADDAGGAQLRRRRRPTWRRFLEERLRFAVSQGVPRGAGSASTRGSASARRWSRTSSCIRRLDVLRRARPASARRRLAQELARAYLRRRGGDDRARPRRASAPRWPPTSAARRSSARTTCARRRGARRRAKAVSAWP